MYVLTGFQFQPNEQEFQRFDCNPWTYRQTDRHRRTDVQTGNLGNTSTDRQTNSYLLVAFVINNPIDLDLSDEIDPVGWKRTRSSDLITVTHTITSLIISRNTSVSPYDWPFGIIGYWNAYVTCHGRGL